MDLLNYNKFITNTKTLKNKILLKIFYNNRNDSYAKEKIKLFRENITQYWCTMSQENKEKLLNLMDIDIDKDEMSNIDNFVKYGWNTPTEEFVKKFYDGDFDYDDEDNEQILKNLRENLSNFWNDLEDNEKEKYIKLVYERYN
jgi:hypothetical protein